MPMLRQLILLLSAIVLAGSVAVTQTIAADKEKAVELIGHVEIDNKYYVKLGVRQSGR